MSQMTEQSESDCNSKTSRNRLDEVVLPYLELPKVSELLSSLSEKERAVTIALAEKEPGERWSTVAKKLGMSPRQLYNYRMRESVLEAYRLIVREICKAEVPDVLKTLVREAKKGRHWAVKQFLEWAEEIRPRGSTGDSFTSINLLSHVRSETVENLMERAREVMGDVAEDKR